VRCDLGESGGRVGHVSSSGISSGFLLVALYKIDARHRHVVKPSFIRNVQICTPYEVGCLQMHVSKVEYEIIIAIVFRRIS
jgi:hypothetical protein